MDEKSDRSHIYALAASDIIDTIEAETEKRIENINFEYDGEDLYPASVTFDKNS